MHKATVTDFESQIHNLRTNSRQLLELARQTSDAKDQVVHAHTSTSRLSYTNNSSIPIPHTALGDSVIKEGNHDHGWED